MAKSKAAASKTPEFSERVARDLIEKIEQGTAPWQKPWQAGDPPERPVNAMTGRPYSGMNRVWLEAQQISDDPRWCTYKQAQDLGAQVQKGEKGTPIQVWIFDKQVARKDESGKPVKDANGEVVKDRVKLERPFAKGATVFHASQIEGLPPYERSGVVQDVDPAERHEAAERILANSGAAIYHDQADSAFYTPARDEIHLPQAGQFESIEAYYAVALHELGHWTGHESRLNRDLQGSKDLQSYAREELRAEIGSYMLAQDLGLEHNPDRHAAYVGSWVKAVKEDPQEILAAAKDAQKISDYVQGFEHENVKSQSQDPPENSLKEQVEKQSEPEPEAEPETER